MSGRPRKFKSVKELQNKIEAYFKNCFKQAFKQILTNEGKLRLAKHKNYRPIDEDFEEIPLLDREGKKVFYQFKPFTITGLALALDTTRETLLDYENEKYDGDVEVGELRKYSDTIKNAKAKIEEYAEEQLYRDKNVAGVIFNLKNNYKGWHDEMKHDHTSNGKDIGTLVYLPKQKKDGSK